jgi:cellulose 1,4-beta-cellobiosidase
LVTLNLQKLKDSGAQNMIAPFVLYNLPDRDCDKPSYGRLPLGDDGENLYKKYIDDIKTAISTFPDITVALIIEPHALENMFTNVPWDANCSKAAPAHKTLIPYAVKTLALPNVAIYLDGGFSWTDFLGWKSGALGRWATLLAGIYKDSGSPAQLRGVRFPPSPFAAG